MTSEARVCTGNCKKSAQDMAVAITRAAHACRYRFFWVVIRYSRFAPLRHYRMVWTNFCFPEIVDLALPAEGVFHNLVFVSIKKTFPMQAYKIMHGLWGMGQMMFTKYIVVVDADVDVHNTSEVLFRLCANTDPQRDAIFTKGPADVLDHATSEIGIGSKLGIDATRKLAGEGFKRPWPPLIRMSEEVRRKIDALLGGKP